MRGMRLFRERKSLFKRKRRLVQRKTNGRKNSKRAKNRSRKHARNWIFSDKTLVVEKSPRGPKGTVLLLYRREMINPLGWIWEKHLKNCSVPGGMQDRLLIRHENTVSPLNGQRWTRVTGWGGQKEQRSGSSLVMLVSERWRQQKNCPCCRVAPAYLLKEVMLRNGYGNSPIWNSVTGAVLRWWRNRMGKPLSPPQIHQKNI